MPSPRPLLLALSLATSLTASLATSLSGAAPDPAPPTHHLDNGTVRAAVTEAIGGRLLSFSLSSKPSFLRLEPGAGDPDAPVDAAGDNVGWLGHEVWVGPQKEWWAHQTVNAGRAAARAVWPPDPWLSLSRYTVKEKSPTAVALESPASPVNGLQLRKRYALVPGQPNSLRLEVEASNRRDTAMAWDIWFNTRVHAGTHVYVPVDGAADVRQQPVEGSGQPDAPRYTVADHMMSLEVPSPGQRARRGKLFVQPSKGWMAGFHDGQVLVIRFAHQPRAAIHPDQGQVELYQDWQPGAPERGLLEMEVHAPYVKLAPGQAMKAAETWTILPYDGAATRAAHLAFLRGHAAELGIRDGQ